ncbi:MAG: HXXEE domain-containing protein [Dehalococcoidia bacterium]
MSLFAWYQHDTHWSRAGLVCASVLLALSPFLWAGLGPVAFLVFLHLPIYLVHQFEEHGHGAFKAEVNQLLPPRIKRVSDAKIFWINILAVWVLLIVVLYLAVYVNPAIGLVAPYLVVVNGLLHTLMAIGRRRPNAGLWTSLTLFLPVGGVSIVLISGAIQASVVAHLAALSVAILGHVVIFGVIALDQIRNPRPAPVQ